MVLLEKCNGKRIVQLFREIITNSETASPLLDRYETKKTKVPFLSGLISLQHTLQLPDQNLISGIALVRKLGLKGVRITQRLILKLTVVCLMMTEKMYSDQQYSISDYSLATGISVEELAELELAIFKLMDYNLMLTEREYLEVATYHQQ